MGKEDKLASFTNDMISYLEKPKDSTKGVTFLVNFFFFLFFYCILGFGVHVQSMQDSCVGTHMAVCFAFLLPFTHIWHFSPGYPSPPPPPAGPPLPPQ